MGSCSKRPSDVSQRGCLHSVVVLHLETAPEERFAHRLAPNPYVGRMPYSIKLSGCFPRGEFVLLCFREQFELSRQITPTCPEM